MPRAGIALRELDRLPRTACRYVIKVFGDIAIAASRWLEMNVARMSQSSGFVSAGAFDIGDRASRLAVRSAGRSMTNIVRSLLTKSVHRSIALRAVFDVRVVHSITRQPNGL
jgi:hypothetical protein